MTDQTTDENMGQSTGQEDTADAAPGDHQGAGDQEVRPTSQRSEDGAQPRGNAEAAKYRRQLRDTEAERDTLRDRVETLQRAEAERLAGVEGVKPSALWSSGTTLDDLLDDDGNVDPVKVTDTARTAIDELGLQRPPRPGYVPAEGTTPDLAKLAPRPGFADAFTPHRR